MEKTLRVYRSKTGEYDCMPVGEPMYGADWYEVGEMRTYDCFYTLTIESDGSNEELEIANSWDELYPEDAGEVARNYLKDWKESEGDPDLDISEYYGSLNEWHIGYDEDYDRYYVYLAEVVDEYRLEV